MPTVTPRNHALDGLRGISAFTVLTWHVYCLLLPLLTTAMQQLLHTFPFSLLLSGTQSVALFFILSGFVLTQTTKNINFSWIEYYPKRILRLYLPVLASFLFAATLILVIPRNFSIYTPDTWLVNSNYDTFTWTDLLQNFTLQTSMLNNPTWSIVYELIFSLTLPLWILILRKTPSLALPPILIGLFTTTWVGITLNNEPLIWYPLFGIGVILNIHLQKILDVTAKIKTSSYKYLYLIGLPAIGIALFSLPGEFNQPTRFLTCISGFLLILAALTVPFFQKPLETKIFQHLGTISFGLYLTHVPIIVTVYVLFPPALAIYSPLVSVPLCLLIATIFAKTIDQPSIKLAARTGKILKKYSEAHHLLIKHSK